MISLNLKNSQEEYRIFSQLKIDITFDQVKLEWMKQNKLKDHNIENRSDLYIIQIQDNQVQYGLKFRDILQLSQNELTLKILELKVRNGQTKESEQWEKVVQKKLPQSITIKTDSSNINQTKDQIKSIIQQHIPDYSLTQNFHLIIVQKFRFSGSCGKLSYEETPLKIILLNENKVIPTSYIFTTCCESKQIKDFESKNSLQQKWNTYSFLSETKSINMGYPEFLMNYLLQQLHPPKI